MDHWDLLAALLVGIAALVVVSLATPAEDRTALTSFFAGLDTPADERNQTRCCWSTRCVRVEEQAG